MNKPLPGYEDSLRVVQRNGDRVISIMEAGTNVAELLGTKPEYLKDKPLVTIFPLRISGIMNDNIEFEEDSPDIGEVLRKIARVTVKTLDGREIPVILRISPHGVDGADIVYSLLIRKEASELSRQEKRVLARRLFENRNYVANDKETGLPDKITFSRDVEMACHIVRSDGADATLALLSVPVEKVGIVKFAAICRQIFRTDDIVARYGNNVLAVLLSDTHENNAPIAFQRLRGGLHNEGISDVMIGYCGVNPVEKSEKLLTRLDEAAKNLKFSTGAQSVVKL